MSTSAEDDLELGQSRLFHVICFSICMSSMYNYIIAHSDVGKAPQG